MTYTLRQAARAAGGELIGPHPDRAVRHWAYDSRLSFARESACFLALSGQARSGMEYVERLYAEGVRCFCTASADAVPDLPEATFWVVPDVLAAVQRLAAHRRRQFAGTVVGITGSNGKTIVKEWLYTLLGGEAASIYRSPQSFNSQLGVAISVLGIPAFAKTALIEAGISQAGEMARLAGMIRPEVGILTNIGQAHAGGFASAQDKAAEKVSLFTGATTVLTRAGTLVAHREAFDNLGPDVEVLTYGLDDEPATPRFQLYPDRDGDNVVNAATRRKFRVEFPFGDAASQENLACALCAALLLGEPADRVVPRVAQLEAPNMRLSVSAGRHGTRIVDDSYSNELAGLRAAVDFLSLRRLPGSRTLAVLGPLLGEAPDAGQLEDVVAALEAAGVTELVLVAGALPQLNGAVFARGIKVVRCPSREAAEAYLTPERVRDATLLIKGPRALRLDRLAAQLRLRTHDVRLEINLAALAHNITAFRARLHPSTKVCVMVKAQAYGSGGRELAQFFERRGVDYLAVAYIDEGIELRRAGCTLPIIVGSSSTDQADLLSQYDLEPEVTTLAQLKSLRGSRVKLHIKLDTGMHRLGFDVTSAAIDSEFEALCQQLTRYPERYQVESFFSHLSASTDPDADGFTAAQNAAFVAACDRLDALLPQRPFRHILNSGGAWRHPSLQHDMVRLGIGVYGLGLPAGDADALEVAHRLVAQLVQIRTVAAGEVVGYGLGGRSDQRRRIGVVNIGYADGLRRAASHGAYALYLQGRGAPIVGSVCMDFCMVDLSGLPEARVGDEVEVFGTQQPIAALAACYGTIPYEVLTGIGQRVRRVYVH